MDLAHPRSPYDAPQLPDQNGMERSTATNAQAEETQGHPPSPNMDDCVHRFLENMKLRFGEQSFEVNAINGILSAFRNANMSKRDAMSSITLTLRNHEDLKQDLMNVLYHKDASWGPGDFDFEKPVTHPCPQFLQPVHQPQMRLPPISSSWYPDRQAVQSINPALLSGYGGSNHTHEEHQELGYTRQGDRNWPSFARVPSSPMLPMPAQFQFSNNFTSPAMNYSTRLAPYAHTAYEADMSLPHQDFSSMPQHTEMQDEWEKAEYGDESAANFDQPWPPTDLKQPPESAQPLASHQPYSPAQYGVFTPCLASPTKKEFSEASPSVLGKPIAIPIGRPAVDMPPPPKKHSRGGSVTHVKADEQLYEDETESRRRAPRPAMDLSGNKQGNDKVDRTRSEGSGLFVHSLCGKGFATRAKVKKHHWGAKMDDLETTTGCWARHKKPNVSWDEHPSCKREAPTTRPVKKASSRSTKRDSDHKAPVVPAMIPSHNTIPGFPTLVDLPQTVAETLTPRPPSGYTFEDVGPYHSHRLPSRGSFDELLTAVNVASRIDAPKPQGRNDSVVSYLDAQAAAAECNRQDLPLWVEGFRGGKNEGLAYGRQSSTTPNGLCISYPNGEMQVSPGTVLPSQIREEEYASPFSPVNTNQSYDHMFSPSKRDQTMFESSISSDLETKRQKVLH